MATQYRDKIFSSLSPAEAHALVAEIDALVEALTPSEADEGPYPDPVEAPWGFNVTSATTERDPDGYALAEIFDDVSLEVDDAPVPAPVLERMGTCRSCIVVEYYARISEKKPFVALQKLLFARVGDALVSDDTELVPIATTIAKLTKHLGSVWTKTPPLGSIETPKKDRKTRPAKEGELEALAVHKRLARIIEGNDPLARGMLEKELRKTTDAVRSYAAALMEEGPTSDAAAAKLLSCSVVEVESARDALTTLLRRIV